MEIKDKLCSLGLTEREADAYISLCNFDEATASKLAKQTKEHRTNVYDSLNGLIKKGLITYNIKNGVRYFRVADPEKILDYVKEKEDIAKRLLPELASRIGSVEEKPTVEIYEGKEGFKSILMKILKERKTLYSIGASEEWEKKFPIKLTQYMKEREETGIRAKLLYVKGTKPIISRLNQVRFLPIEFAQPSTIAIFGDYVAMLMWTEPMVATLTKSRQLSNSFLKYFEVLWRTAKP
jgi:sugar-specific transcriptional regulator TrmB